MQNEGQLAQPFIGGVIINPNEEDADSFLVYKQPTQVFQHALEYYKQRHQLLTLYTGLKFMASMTLIILNYTLNSCMQDDYSTSNIWGVQYLEPWMIASTIHSFFATLYYIRLLTHTNNSDNLTNIAESLEHCIIIEIPTNLNEQEVDALIDEQTEQQNQEIQMRVDLDLQIEESRRLQMLAQEIKKKVQSSSKFAMYVGKSCFVAFQLLQIWGLVFYLSNYNQQIEGCYNMYSNYLFLAIFLGLYQYLELYIMAILIIIFLPLLLFYTAYDWIKNYFQKRRERVRIENALSESTYNTEQGTSGDNECSICMCTYENKDKLITLQCSDKHHFHSSCIKSWLEVNNKCPLCRNNVLDDPL